MRYQITNYPGCITVVCRDGNEPDKHGRVPVQREDNHQWMLINKKWLRPLQGLSETEVSAPAHSAGAGADASASDAALTLHSGSTSDLDASLRAGRTNVSQPGEPTPVHDWTLVNRELFHAFHTLWIAEINGALNDGLLPSGYYALPEQHAGDCIADILTLHASPAETPRLPLPPATGGTAVAEAPPRTRRRQTVEPATAELRRSVAIRHVSGHRLVALLEIVSPGNKDRPRCVDDFAAKAVEAIEVGVHVLMVDLFPPGPHDPRGVHAIIRQRLERSEEPYAYDLPADEPLTLASYAAGVPVEIYLEHLAVGAALPQMPLFLRPDRYVNVPLEPTYQGAWARMPTFWRDVLEGRATGV